jgi:phage recombination protein Bet
MSYPVVRPNQTAAPSIQDRVNAIGAEYQFTPAQMQLITDVIARGASPDELRLFLYRCQKMGLDPLKAGQIFFIKYGTNPGTIVVGIEGFRARATRTGKLRGIKRGVLRNDKGECVGAWAKVRRADWDEPAEVEVSFAEYNTGRAEWKNKPETMIQKVAEAAALRMAFPDELGDAYSKEEMDRTIDNPSAITGEQPSIYDGDPARFESTGEYKIPFGQWKTRTIAEVLRNEGPKPLASYVARLEDPTEIEKIKKNWPHMIPQMPEFIERASDAIATYERDIADQMRSGA